MAISQITSGTRYTQGAEKTAAEKKAGSAAFEREAVHETVARDKEDTFVRAKADETTEVGYRPAKKLSGSEIEAIKDARAERMKRLITEMMGRQAVQVKMVQSVVPEQQPGVVNDSNDWMSQFLSPQDTPETAAKAIAKDGAWGVNAVATRLLDMAVSLSVGDTSKISVLRGAVEEGFKAAAKVLGGALPGVCQETYTETMKRFDYWEQHGSLDGYVMQD